MFSNQFFFGVFLLISFTTFSQDGYLLRQQYGKSKDFFSTEKKWVYEVTGLINQYDTRDRETTPKIGWEIGVHIERRIKKEFSLSSGIIFQNINYAYNTISSNATSTFEDTSVDKLTFLSVPLTARVFPMKRIAIEFGIAYHIYLFGKGNPPDLAPNNNNVTYPSGKFSNSIGFLLGLQYSIYKNFVGVAYYSFRKNEDNFAERETNNFSGIAVGLRYRLFNR